MDWQDEYERKKITVNQVFEQHLTGNQKIYTGGLHVPTTIINALISRVAEGALTGIDLYGNWMNGDITFAGLEVTPEQFRYHTYFAGPNERTGFANGSKCVAHIPVHFSDTNRMLEEVGLDYAVVQMTPPDAQGNCNIGPLGFEQGALRGAKHIIAQINPRLPRVFGDSHNYHVSAIDAFVLKEEQLEDVQVPAPTPEEAKVAEFIVDRVNDGDTIQLGIGGIINAIAAGLEQAASGLLHRDVLGCLCRAAAKGRHRQLTKELHARRFSCRLFDWHAASVRLHPRKPQHVLFLLRNGMQPCLHR